MDDFSSLLTSPIHKQTSQQAEMGDSFLAAIQDRPDGEQVMLADLIPFEWDRVCFFGMGVSSTEINQVLGFTWLNQEEYVEEQRQILVFVRDQQVVEHLVFRPEVIGSRTLTDDGLGVCLSRNEAVLTVMSDASAEGRMVYLLLPDAAKSLIPPSAA